MLLIFRLFFFWFRYIFSFFRFFFLPLIAIYCCCDFCNYFQLFCCVFIENYFYVYVFNEFLNLSSYVNGQKIPATKGVPVVLQNSMQIKFGGSSRKYKVIGLNTAGSKKVKTDVGGADAANPFRFSNSSEISDVAPQLRTLNPELSLSTLLPPALVDRDSAKLASIEKPRGETAFSAQSSLNKLAHERIQAAEKLVKRADSIAFLG